MSTSPTFSAQLLGQTEKSLNAILDRLLAGTGLTEHRWIALRLTVMSGGSVDRDELTTRVAGGLKVSEAEARARVAELAAAQLVHVEGETVRLTDAGRELHAVIRAAVAEVTERMWGDLPAEDLATAGRVLSTVLARAEVEHARLAA